MRDEEHSKGLQFWYMVIHWTELFWWPVNFISWPNSSSPMVFNFSMWFLEFCYWTMIILYSSPFSWIFPVFKFLGCSMFVSFSWHLSFHQSLDCLIILTHQECWFHVISAISESTFSMGQNYEMCLFIVKEKKKKKKIKRKEILN